MKKLAIVTVGDIRYYGGAEKYTIELVKRIKDNFDVTVYSFIDNRILKLSTEEVKEMLGSASLVFYKVIGKGMVRIPVTKAGLKAYLSMMKYDCVYFIDYGMVPILFILASTKLGKARSILGLHDPGLIKKIHSHWLYRIFFFLLPNLHVLNSDTFETLRSIGYPGKIYFIPNFLYLNKNNNYHSETGKFIVIFVGRLLTYHKGIDLLEDIIIKTLKINNKIEFHIVGSGGDGAVIINRLKSQYPSNVLYMGFLSEHDLGEEYKRASIAIITSRFEALPAVVLEAQSYGLPVIAFDIGGVNDIISDSSGSLIKAFDINLFSNEILKYFNMWSEGILNLEMRNSIVRNLRSKFSDESIIPQIVDMFTGRRA